MLIENDNHYRTLYVVVRLSELDLKTWILMRLKKMKMVIVFILSFPQFSKVFHNPVESRWKLV